MEQFQKQCFEQNDAFYTIQLDVTDSEALYLESELIYTTIDKTN